MSTTFEILNQQLGLYRQQAEEWKAGHIEAMRCRDIEDAIRYGLFLLETIQRQNARWAEDVEHKVVPFTWETARQFADAYQWWTAESRTLLAAVQAFEARGFGVDGAGNFREKNREVSLVPLDVEKVRRSISRSIAAKAFP